MSEPQRLGEILVDLLEPCSHERTEVRYKTGANGIKLLGTQCMMCGQMPKGAQWLSQKGVDIHSFEEFDETISERWRAAQNQARQLKLQKEKLERHLEYERYIRESPEWQAIRVKVTKRDGYLCQACLETGATEVHHKNYLHLFDEILFDLIAVCRPCHQKIHGRIE
jgi:5-methylcytosine-specific restriction endonuclease McrA